MTTDRRSRDIAYEGDGTTTTFTVNFRFLESEDLRVALVDLDSGDITDLAYPANFSTSGEGDEAGGSVTLNVAPDDRTRVRIRSFTNRAQLTDYATNDTFPAETHERALDRGSLVDQELDQALGALTARTLRVRDGETIAEMPGSAADRATKALGFDADGDPVFLTINEGDGDLRADLAASSGSSLVGFLQAGSGAVARSVQSKLRELVSITDFGAVAYGDAAAAIAGTDSTAAINAALARGPAFIPAGYFRYTGALVANLAGSGLFGLGKARSFLVTGNSLDRHLSCIAGKPASFVGFRMIGPSDFDGTAFNRALTIGMKPDMSDITTAPWDASGVWIDDFAVYGMATGIHFAWSDDAGFGSVQFNECGDSRAEPGGYGITCSGSRIHGENVIAVNTLTRGRHAVYWTGPANDCFVQNVYAVGWDLAPIQNRATTTGGRNNGFGRLLAIDCNTNDELVDTLGGVANWITASDLVLDDAGSGRIGDITMIDCGGKAIGIRNMPDTRCGKVTVIGHTGNWGDGARYLVHAYNSPNVGLPDVDVRSGFGTDGLNDNTLRLIEIELSDKCHGGSLRIDGVFDRGLDFTTSDNCRFGTLTLTFQNSDVETETCYAVQVNSCDGNVVEELVLDGTYTAAARFTGTSDQCTVRRVTPLTEPVVGLTLDVTTALQFNSVMRAEGYDLLTVGSGSVIDVAGYRTVRLTHATPTDLTNFTGLQQGQRVLVRSMTSEQVTLKHAAGGVGAIFLRSNIDRLLKTRESLNLDGHVTEFGGDHTFRCMEPGADDLTP